MRLRKIIISANDTSYIYNLRRELIKSLLDKGFAITVVANVDRYSSELSELGCSLVNMEISRHGTNPVSDLDLYLKFKKTLDIERPDIVLSFNIKPNIYLGMLCKKMNIFFIPNITGLGGALINPGVVQKIAITLYKLGMRGANVILFQNESNRKFFISKKIIKNSQNNYLIPGSGININEFIYKNYPENRNITKFIMISRIMKDKGIEEFIKSAKYIKERYPNVVFNLVGSFDDDSYKEIIERMNNNGIINYLGFREDIIDLICDSNCVIHPSYHEGLSNVLLEAGATGRPVIASDIPGCRETFIDGKSGLSVQPKNVKDLIEKIEKFIHLSYGEKEKMGLENRHHIEEKFDRKIVVEKYLECIEEYAK